MEIKKVVIGSKQNDKEGSLPAIVDESHTEEDLNSVMKSYYIDSSSSRIAQIQMKNNIANDKTLDIIYGLIGKEVMILKTKLTSIRLKMGSIAENVKMKRLPEYSCVIKDVDIYKNGNVVITYCQKYLEEESKLRTITFNKDNVTLDEENIFIKYDPDLYNESKVIGIVSMQDDVHDYIYSRYYAQQVRDFKLAEEIKSNMVKNNTVSEKAQELYDRLYSMIGKKFVFLKSSSSGPKLKLGNFIENFKATQHRVHPIIVRNINVITPEVFDIEYSSTSPSASIGHFRHCKISNTIFQNDTIYVSFDNRESKNPSYKLYGFFKEDIDINKYLYDEEFRNKLEEIRQEGIVPKYKDIIVSEGNKEEIYKEIKDNYLREKCIISFKSLTKKYSKVDIPSVISGIEILPILSIDKPNTPVSHNISIMAWTGDTINIENTVVIKNGDTVRISLVDTDKYIKIQLIQIGFEFDIKLNKTLGGIDNEKTE